MFQNDTTTAPDRRPAILICGGPLAWIVVNGLAARLGDIDVIIEKPESKLFILRRRARLLGWGTALGQAAFGVLSKITAHRQAPRIADICRTHGLDTQPGARVRLHHVASINSAEAWTLLRRLNPSVVGVYGTRILKRDTLKSIAAPFINYHAGINPKYRGQHPAYWALATGDACNAGVTVHLVDEGVDTGDVLYQANVRFEPEDTIATYQYVQAAHGVPLLARAMQDAIAGRLAPRRVELPSQRYFPPTLWGYLGRGLTRGVW